MPFDGSFIITATIRSNSINLNELQGGTGSPQKSMATFKPLLEPWLYSSSFLMEPFGPPVFVLTSYVPASCHLYK